MTSIAIKPTCRGNSGAPCDALLREPEVVLADPDRWANHLCPEVARHSTRQWARRRAGDLYGSNVPREVKQWITSYPLPVGALSMPDGVPSGIAPLPACGKAGLILVADIPFVTCEAFGIVDDHVAITLESEGAYTLRRASMQFATAGWKNDRVDPFQRRADKWWRGEAATGREKGPKNAREQARDAYNEYRKQLGRAPTQTELAVKLGVNPKTLRNNIGSWRDFEREAQEWQRMCDDFAATVPNDSEMDRMQRSVSGK